MVSGIQTLSFYFRFEENNKQAGAELCQAQSQLGLIKLQTDNF